MLKKYNRKIILEDGHEFCGYAFGDTEDKICEIVFNTSMVGYQEILSDPSYTFQAVVMTYPLIGNYGMAADDYETICGWSYMRNSSEICQVCMLPAIYLKRQLSPALRVKKNRCKNPAGQAKKRPICNWNLK